MAERADGETSQVAERYAQAAFELGLEQNALDALEKDLALMTEAFTASADLRQAARSPLIDPAEKARALSAVAKKIGLSDLGVKLVGATAANRRAGELPAIARAYGRLLARHRGARQVEIISARPLTKTDRDVILAGLGKALGGAVSAVERVDENLIGGFVVRVGSRQFDASIRAKLDALKLAMASA